MTSNQDERRLVGRAILVVVTVGATLIPMPLLVTYVRNILTGDPPAYPWVFVFGVCILSGLLGSASLGIYLWNDPRRESSRQLTLSFVGVAIASAAAFLPVVFLMIP